MSQQGGYNQTILLDANYDLQQRETSSTKATGLTVATTVGSNKITITEIGHSKKVGDAICITNAAVEPLNGFNLNSPDLIVYDIVDANNYRVSYYTAATASGTGSTTADVSWYSGNCLAHMDDQYSTDYQTTGTHRVYGSKFYKFRDCHTEFVTFTLDLTGGVSGSNMTYQGLEQYMSPDVAFIMSMKVNSTVATTNSSFGNVIYGGNNYTARTIRTMDASPDVIDSRMEYIKPYRIEPTDPISVEWTESGATGIFPKTVTVTLEIAHTGITYNRR